MGLLHAVLLRDAVRDNGPDGAAVRLDALTEELLAPVYHRVAEWEERDPVMHGGWPGDALAAGVTDADPAADPGDGPGGVARALLERVARLEAEGASTARTGPSRADLMAAVAGARAGL
jgi:hypothetical protein